MEMINQTELSLSAAALAFAALGSEPRLLVLTTLVRAGEGGLTTGDLATRSGISGSTLTHHIRALAQAGLVVQEKRGRSIVCSATFEQVQHLSDFLLSECCQDCHGCGHADHHHVAARGN